MIIELEDFRKGSKITLSIREEHIEKVDLTTLIRENIKLLENSKERISLFIMIKD
jgi:RPA family protein